MKNTLIKYAEIEVDRRDKMREVHEAQLYVAEQRGRNMAVDYIKKEISKPYMRPDHAILDEARIMTL